jgi:hypothetical protein
MLGSFPIPMFMSDSQSTLAPENVVLGAKSILRILEGNESTLSDFMLLDALLDYAPTAHGKEAIARDVITAFETRESFETATKELAEHFYNTLLLPSISS